MAEILEGAMSRNSSDGQTGTFNERRLREIGTFDGMEGMCKEWSSKFKGAAKGVNLHEAIKAAEGKNDKIAYETLNEEQTELSAAICNLLMMLATGAAFTIHPSVSDENGLEMCRLTKRYNPWTPMRGL